MCGRVTIFVVANLDHGHFKAKLVSQVAELLDARFDRVIAAPVDCGWLTVGPVEVRDFVRELVVHLGARGGVTIARCICHCIRWECREIF